jgi:hypothetical protein
LADNADFSSDFSQEFPAAFPGQTVAPIPGHTLWHLGRPGNAVTLGQSFWKIADFTSQQTLTQADNPPTEFSHNFSTDFAIALPAQTQAPIPGHSLWHLAKPGNAITLGQTFWKIADHMPPIPAFDAGGDAPVISAVGSSSGSATSQTITWVTDVLSDSQVDYDPA